MIRDHYDQEALEAQAAMERELEAESHYPLAKDMYAVFDGRHKLVFVPDVDSFYLFDLAVDPDRVNVVSKGDEAALSDGTADQMRLDRRAQFVVIKGS